MVILFYAPREILNMIGKKSEITRSSGDVNACGNSRSFVLTSANKPQSRKKSWDFGFDAEPLHVKFTVSFLSEMLKYFPYRYLQSVSTFG